MLDPHDRSTLFEALRPPTGYTLDQAVGTSFTLDLEALLTTPVAFALFSSRASDPGPDGLEPVELLESVRRHAERITIFCQEGHIAVPAKHRDAFAWLEDSVVPVAPPRQGSLFHPKVWVIRYITESSEHSVTRVLLPTRNLTFDTSWDTILQLESDAASPDGGNGAALAGFLRHLPDLASPGSLHPSRAHAVDLLAGQLEHLQFAPPAPYRELDFHTFGWGRSPSVIPPESRRLLVVTPFVNDRFIASVPDHVELTALITRQSSAEALSEDSQRRIRRLAVLDPAVDLLTASVEVEDGTAVSSAPTHGNLHAKMFVADLPDGALLVTGSANATWAAFNANVEVVASMRGPKSAGIESVLHSDPDAPGGLGSILRDLDPVELQAAADDDAERAGRLLDQYRRSVASISFAATVNNDLEDDQFVLHLTSADVVPVAAPDLADVEVTIRPSAIADRSREAILSLGRRADLSFETSLHGLSAFFVIRIQAVVDGTRRSTSTLVVVPLEGAPPDRKSRLLASLLVDPGRLLAYLMLLLAPDGESAAGGGGELGSWLKRTSTGNLDDSPILELLVRAAARHPQRLAELGRLLDELGEEADRVLPKRFAEIWGPVRNAIGGPDA